MARSARLAVAGELHHVLQRGHNRQSVFLDEQDRSAYLALLHESAMQYGVAIHAYALLDVEVHLLATPASAESFSRLMQSLGRRYVAAFNRRHGRSGTLWAGRFSAGVIDGTSLGLDATVYVESLPVTAGLVGTAGEWPWSSAAHHLGRRRDPLISEHPSYWALGNTPFERELAHAHRLHEGMSVEQSRRFKQNSGRALGPPAFTMRIAERTGLSLQSKPRGRPTRTAKVAQ
jgi:putative transposase